MQGKSRGGTLRIAYCVTAPGTTGRSAGAVTQYAIAASTSPKSVRPDDAQPGSGTPPSRPALTRSDALPTFRAMTSLPVRHHHAHHHAHTGPGARERARTTR